MKKHENTNALKEALKSYEETPTYGHELNLMLMISIATSLACIADAIMIEEPKTDLLDKIRAEIHATAEMHENGNYYLREEWIDEIIDKYKVESEDKE